MYLICSRRSKRNFVGEEECYCRVSSVIYSFHKVHIHQINLKEAQTPLAKLIKAAASGEEVMITRSDGTSLKDVPINLSKQPPRFGSAKGLIKMSNDFDEPLFNSP